MTEARSTPEDRRRPAAVRPVIASMVVGLAVSVACIEAGFASNDYRHGKRVQELMKNKGSYEECNERWKRELEDEEFRGFVARVLESSDAFAGVPVPEVNYYGLPFETAWLRYQTREGGGYPAANRYAAAGCYILVRTA